MKHCQLIMFVYVHRNHTTVKEMKKVTELSHETFQNQQSHEQIAAIKTSFMQVFAIFFLSVIQLPGNASFWCDSQNGSQKKRKKHSIWVIDNQKSTNADPINQVAARMASQLQLQLWKIKIIIIITKRGRLKQHICGQQPPLCLWLLFSHFLIFFPLSSSFLLFLKTKLDMHCGADAPRRAN